MANEQARTRLDLTGEIFVRYGYAADEIHVLTDELSADLLPWVRTNGTGWGV